jgi:hypothetical protein
MTPPARPEGSAGSTRWASGKMTAAVIAIGRPAAWLVALAGFLVRAGVVLFVWPIVVLPTPTGLATFFGEDVAALALGGPSPQTLQAIAIAIGLFVAWLVGGGLIAAATEVALIETVAGDEELAATSGPSIAAPTARRMRRVRVLGARLIAHLPLVLALVWAVPVVVGATYHELILPDDLATPIALRVVRDVPAALALLLAAWLLGETAGAIAARSIVLDDRSVGHALLDAIRLTVRRPITTVATALLGLVVAVAMTAPALIASSVIWSEVRIALVVGTDLVTILAGTVLLVGAWTAGLVLTAAAAAWRSAAWTVEAKRAVAPWPIARIVRGRPVARGA